MLRREVRKAAHPKGHATEFYSHERRRLSVAKTSRRAHRSTFVNGRELRRGAVCKSPISPRGIVRNGQGYTEAAHWDPGGYHIMLKMCTFNLTIKSALHADI